MLWAQKNYDDWLKDLSNKFVMAEHRLLNKFTAAHRRITESWIVEIISSYPRLHVDWRCAFFTSLLGAGVTGQLESIWKYYFTTSSVTSHLWTRL